MKSRINRVRNASRKPRRQLMTTALVATMVLALGAITVLSRQKANTGRKSEMADKTKFLKTEFAPQDVALSGDEPQALTAEEAQKLGAGLKELVNQSTDGLVEVKHDDGTVSVDLQGRFQNVAVARINKDGSVTQSCVDNPKSAAAFFGIDPKLIDNTLTSSGAKPSKVSQSRNKS